MDGAPIENGAVEVTGETITRVGRWEEFRGGSRAEILDLGERVLLPGLVNAHCHFDYTMLRGVIPAPTSFTAWIKEINRHKAGFTPADYVGAIRAGAAEAAASGTTTVANLEAFPDLIEEVGELPLRVWWLAEMIDVRGEVSAEEKLAEAERGRPGRGGIGLAPHAPFTASAKLYAETAQLAAERGIPVTTHLAESVEETAMFRDGRGPLFDFLRELGRPMEDCGRATSLALLLKQGVLSERWLVAHLNELSSGDRELLAGAPRFHVVHCPRSHAYFGHARFDWATWRALGFNLCLGTDSLASNADLDLFAEMRQLRKAEPALSADEILKMATVNGAAALGQQECSGQGAGGLFRRFDCSALVHDQSGAGGRSH